VGIALWEGYGLTETSPVIALNTPLSHRMGAAGMPLPNLELKLAADGELLVRGPSVFAGYWQKPERCRMPSTRRDGSAPATSAAWTRMASSSSPTARRSC
jgi:acyl-CoA synthetase (AMP-forming)/AMP-acid ligase II